MLSRGLRGTDVRGWEGNHRLAPQRQSLWHEGRRFAEWDESSSRRSRTHSSILPLAVGALHFLLFTVLFWRVRGTFFGGDSGEFLAISDAIRSGAVIGDLNYGKPLGYPLLLALVTSLPGTPVVNTLICHAVFYLLTIHLLGRLAHLLGCSSDVARVTQIIFALVPNTAAWANLVLSDTMAMVLLVSSFWAYLKAGQVEEDAQTLRYRVLLGVLLGLLAVTRTEYVLLLPITTVLFGFRWVRRNHLKRALTSVIVIWISSLPILMLQPMLSLASGRVSFVPPKQSGFLALWGSQYDLEFTQLRFSRLADIVYAVSESPAVDDGVIQAKLHSLEYSEAGEDPIGTVLLDQAQRDIQRLRELVGIEGYPPLVAYRKLAWESLLQDPWRFIARAVRRLGLFMTAVELDWPHRHPAHWWYTVVLRPVSTLAYLWLGLGLVLSRGAARERIVELALWASFPILAHAMFILEQRFAYPSVPLLCMIWGWAIQAFLTWRRHRFTQAQDMVGLVQPAAISQSHP